ncbi:hypothetical protein QBC38DRAFT_485854 [Podospora fimiseda]|uniref:Uncharacterized protein n=1 Tax=Podospora fimiseda TaxID=252190 RepID=A0AAN7BJ47_9PEZI|nr:hypothetical protein QBC38DRAFT_485854 [Podospora fimiseda]
MNDPIPTQADRDEMTRKQIPIPTQLSAPVLSSPSSYDPTYVFGSAYPNDRDSFARFSYVPENVKKNATNPLHASTHTVSHDQKFTNQPFQRQIDEKKRLLDQHQRREAALRDQKMKIMEQQQQKSFLPFKGPAQGSLDEFGYGLPWGQLPEPDPRMERRDAVSVSGEEAIKIKAAAAAGANGNSGVSRNLSALMGMEEQDALVKDVPVKAAPAAAANADNIAMQTLNTLAGSCVPDDKISSVTICPNKDLEALRVATEKLRDAKEQLDRMTGETMERVKERSKEILKEMKEIQAMTECKRMGCKMTEVQGPMLRGYCLECWWQWHVAILNFLAVKFQQSWMNLTLNKVKRTMRAPVSSKGKATSAGQAVRTLPKNYDVRLIVAGSWLIVTGLLVGICMTITEPVLKSLVEAYFNLLYAVAGIVAILSSILLAGAYMDYRERKNQVKA